MRPSAQHCRALLDRFQCWITASCDRCGRLLGAIRWTRKGEPGEWCSRECRDGEAEAQALESRRATRKAGRPRLKISDENKAQRLRSQQKEASRRYRARQNCSVIKNCQQLFETAALADAKISSLVSVPYRSALSLHAAPIAKDAP